MMLEDSPVYPVMEDPGTRAEPDLFITYLPHHTDLIYSMSGCIFFPGNRMRPADIATADAVIAPGRAVCAGVMIRIRGKI